MSEYEPPRPLWNQTEVAEYLGVSRWTVNRLVERDLGFPAPLRLSPRTPRWRPEDVEAWVRERQAEAEAVRHREVKVPNVRR